MGRHAVAHDLSTEGRDRYEARVERIRARRPGGQDQVDRVGSADDGGHRRLDGVGVVLHIVDRDDRRPEAVDLRPDTRLEPLAGRRPDRFLDDHPDAARYEWRDPDQRTSPETGQSGSGVNRRLVDDVWRDLDARDEVARLDYLPVEDRKDLARADPVEQ